MYLSQLHTKIERTFFFVLVILYLTADTVYKIHLRTRLLGAFPGKPSSFSVESFKIYNKKGIVRTFYLVMCNLCVVNDYKHNLFITINYLKNDFITNKLLFFLEI